MWRADEIADLFALGPVLVLAHADHGDHRGVPPCPAGAVLVAQVAGQDVLAAVRAGSPVLRLAYDGGDDGRCEAELALDGVFLLAARDREGAAHVLAHPPLPDALAVHEPIQVPRLLAELGLMPPRPVWALPEDASQVTQGLERAEPDKPAALARLRERSGQVWLLLRTAAPGLRLAHDHGDATEHALLLAAETDDLTIDAAGVHWLQDGGRMHAPWAAIAAMQGADDLRGWFWPSDLPPRLRSDYGHSAAWGMVRNNAGVSLGEVPPLPPVELLPPPADLGPHEALAHCLAHGAGMVLVDASDTEVPAGLEAQAVVVVPLGVPGMAVSIACDATGFTAQMPDAHGRPGELRATWSAVLAVSSFGGTLHGAWSWPEHAGPRLRAQGLGESELVVTVDQPCGSADADGQPTLHVEVRLPMRVVH
jgi:hypothetical protein